MNGTNLIPTAPGGLAPTMDVRRLVADFLAGLSPLTRRAYRQDLEAFRAFTGAPDVDGAIRLLLANGAGPANALALEYRTALQARGLAPATTNRRLSALRSVVKLARVLGMVSWKIEVGGLKTTPYRDTRGPGLDGFKKLIRVLETRRAPKARRDLAIVRLLHDCALRRAEVVALDLEDVDLEAGTVAVLGKGRTEKEALTLPAPTAAALAKWIDARGQEPGALFGSPDRKGKPGRYTGSAIFYMVRSLARKAGVPKARPHALRHSAITLALDVTNGDVRAVARYARHASPSTTLRYDDNRQDLGGKVAELVATA